MGRGLSEQGRKKPTISHLQLLSGPKHPETNRKIFSNLSIDDTTPGTKQSQIQQTPKLTTKSETPINVKNKTHS